MKRFLKRLIVLPAYLVYLFVDLIVGISIQRDVWKELVDWSNKE